MTPFFFSDISGNRVTLYDEEAKHCVKVMRKREGEDVIGIDGKGNMYVAQIEELGKRKAFLRIISQEKDWGEKPQQISLLVSPLHKVDRFEWLAEKAVELGVNQIIPYIGTHTVKTGVRVDRLERICMAALKQCLRSRLPEIHEPMGLEEAIEIAEADIKLMGHGPSGKVFSGLQSEIGKSNSVAILIGPEGDFDDRELAIAKEAGFHSVSLGNNRLRSETAAIHLLGLVKQTMGY